MIQQTNPIAKPSSGGLSIQIGDGEFNFQSYILADSKVEADQILRQAGFNPTVDHRLVELTFPGTKSWDDDEVLKFKRGEDRHFLVGKLDRLMALTIDDIVHELPFAEMSEPALRRIACVPDKNVLVLSRENQPDLPLGPDAVVSFDGQGVERLLTKEATVTICLDGKGEREIPRGSYALSKLMALLAIPASYVLSYVDEAGKLMPLDAGGSVNVFDGIKFFSHAAGGGAS